MHVTGPIEFVGQAIKGCLALLILIPLVTYIAYKLYF